MTRQGIWGKLTGLPKAGASREAGEWGAVPFQTFPLAASKVCITAVRLVMFSYTILGDFCSPQPHGRSWLGTTLLAYSPRKGLQLPFK